MESVLYSLAELQALDESAWHVAFSEFNRIALAAALRENLTDADAREVAGEAITELVPRIGQLNSLEELTRNLVQIAKNRARDWWRRQTAQKRDVRQVESLDAPVEEGAQAWEPAAGSATPDQCVEQAELAAQVALLVESLPEKDRRLAQELFFTDQTQQEVANRLQLSLGSIGVMKGRVLGRLQQLIERQPHWRLRLGLTALFLLFSLGLYRLNQPEP